MFKNVLISVSDKTGIIEFASWLKHQGARIVSTGGTSVLLKNAGIDVVDVSEQTGFPEVMGGRVKTLHPSVHMAILARLNNEADSATLEQFSIAPFDCVVGNLYPFAQALASGKTDQLTDYIDIGGPSFLRAAAKNFERVAVVCDPADYSAIQNQKGQLNLSERQKLAVKVFKMTANYDAMIAAAFQVEDAQATSTPPKIQLVEPIELRYGENPQQSAQWYRQSEQKLNLRSAEILQGKELSYNNLLDLDAAAETLQLFGAQPTVVAVKHNNPCGIASHADSETAVKLALSADSISVFGGVIAVNFKIDVNHVRLFANVFLEAVIAPDISDEAKIELQKKKNLRVLRWPQLLDQRSALVFRQIAGGFLVQDRDALVIDWDNWKIFGQSPDKQMKTALEFAWRCVASLKSNAIAVTDSTMSFGFGMGQVNRVDAVKQAILRWKTQHPSQSKAVLASDAFFPFADNIEEIANAGIQWVIQPGGSVKDPEVISKAAELGVNMIFTGRRHFRH